MFNTQVIIFGLVVLVSLVSISEASKSVIQQEGQKSDKGRQAEQQETGTGNSKSKQTQIQENGGTQNQQQIVSDSLFLGQLGPMDDGSGAAGVADGSESGLGQTGTVPDKSPMAY